MASAPGENGDQLRERFLRSFLDWVMLAILRERPTFGYEIINIIESEYGVYISPGSLYPILYDLEHSGFVSGAWEEPTRKSRKIYRLTTDGERHLRDGLDTLGRVLTSLRRPG